MKEIAKYFDALNLPPEVLGSILNFLPYPFLLSRKINGAPHIVFLNDKFVKEIGYTVDDLPNQQVWFEKVYPDAAYREEVMSEWQRLITEATSTESPRASIQVVMQTKQNGQQWYEVTSSLFEEVEVVAFININKVKANEAKLEEENRNRDKILSVLSHDLRSPIANLVSLTKLFYQSKLTTDEFNKVMITVHQDVVQAYDLLETILTWTKSNFNRLESKKTEINLHPLVYGILDLFESDLKNKSVEVELLVTSAPGFSDAAILNIVLRNLISNAIKFSSPGKKILIRTDRVDHEMCISVSDSGTGMNPEAIRFITTDQPFSKAGTLREQGFGLGLRLCREFLPLISGQLEIASEEGAGTTMTIRFPF